MKEIVAAKTVTGEKNSIKYSIIIPDVVKLMTGFISGGDRVIIPVSAKDNQVAFWETGGRDPRYPSAVGTVISGREDRLLEPVFLNKLGRIPNGRQALVSLKPGYRVYVGKLGVQSILAPRIKMARLVYDAKDETMSDEKTVYGRFFVDEIFMDYPSIIGCLPAERLVDKLLTKNVSKPYFVNGWSVSEISNLGGYDKISNEYVRLSELDVPTQSLTAHANQCLDTVENEIIKLKNPKLSAVFQYIDFREGMVRLTPLTGIEMSDINKTIANASGHISFEVPISTLLSSNDERVCYNKNILFESENSVTLEKVLQFDDRYCVRIGDRGYGCLRGYRG